MDRAERERLEWMRERTRLAPMEAALLAEANKADRRTRIAAAAEPVVDPAYWPSVDRVMAGSTVEAEALILVHAWGGSLGERARGIRAHMVTR